MTVAETFEFEGKSYEIRIVHANGRFCVHAYLDNQRANGLEYCIDEDTNFDVSQQMKGVSGIKHLIKQAKFDVENKVWENYRVALRELDKEEKANKANKKPSGSAGEIKTS